MATSQLLLECLIADGFPKNQNTSDVANYFRATTGVPAVRLALLPSGRWVFQVCSHSDRKKCLYKRTSCLKFEGQNYLITLNPPQVEDIPDKWWSAPEPEVPDSGNLKSVSSDELFESRNPNKQFVQVETSEATDGSVMEPYSTSGVQSQMFPELNPELSESLQQVHPGKTYQYGMYPDLTHLQPQHVSYMLQMTSTSGDIRKSAGEDGYDFRHAGELPEHEEGDQKVAFADASFQGEDLISFDNNLHSDFDVLSLPLDSLSSEPRRQYFLRVTELPITANELDLRTYFEDRKNGGGPVLKIDLRGGAGEADIYFDDENIIQRVMNKAPHLLMNKKIKVELVSESKEHDKAQECCIVEVRSVPDEVMKEMCLLYFENPSKGGGDIEDSNWNEEEKVLYITFVDAAVAKQVTTRGHTVGGKVLEVTLYTPPPVVEDKGQCTLEVRGFDPQKLELYQLYFENPRKVAGTVTNFQVSEDNDVIYITFQTPEEAEQVAKGTHKVGGKELQVSLAPKEDPLTSQSCTIKITKGDLQQLELYSLYFENPKKSGGGIIKETRVDEKDHAVYITFEDPETASMVCNRTHHVGNRDLEVTLYVPEKTMRPKSVEEKTVKKQECQEEPLRTVEVNVGDNIQSEDTYIFYFEAKRHGGGDVEKVEIDREKGLVCVTFVKPEVAERVASQQHKIAGQPVEVTLYVPPIPKPPYPDKLLFHNVAESTTRDCLAMYLERITGQEPTDLIYADEVGNVLAVFDEDPDFSKVQEMCRQKKLEGRQISVSKVPISNCVLVENLNKNTTEDTLLFYFEGKRSGGGPVEKVTIDHENGRCLVFFENYEVIESILAKSHTLDGSKLTVKRYMECLGPSGGSRDATTFTLPKPVEFKDVDKYKVAFIRQSATLQAGLTLKLKDLHANPKFSDNMLSAECTLTTSVQHARVLARTWTNDVQQAVESMYSMIVVLRQEVMQEIWDETEKSVTTIKPASRDSAVIFTLSEEKAFIVVGMKSMADDLMKQVKHIVTQKEEEAERKKQEITETNKNLKLFQLRLLAAFSFPSEAAKRHPGLKVDIRTAKGEISYHGLLRDVKEAQVEMYELLQSVKSDKLTNMSNLQKSLLGTKETRDYVIHKFKTEKIVAVWDVDSQGEVAVYCFSDKYLVNAIHIMQKSVVQHQRPLEPETADLLMSSEWNQFVGKITGDHTGVLKIVPMHNGHQLFIAGTDNIMHAVIEETERFLKENTIYMLSCHFFPSLQFFVVNYWRARVIGLSNNLRAYKVELTVDESGQEFQIRGTQMGLDLMTKNLEQVGSEVKCHRETLTEQAKVKFLSSPDCEKELEKLGRSVQCVFSLREEPSTLTIKVSRSTPRIGDEAPSEEKSAITVQLPGGVTIMAVHGDITKLPVEVIVNAANSRLDHIGGLAKDIANKGGKDIQDECNRYMRARGTDLREGDTFRSGPGTLSCKAIIHAVGPMYRGGKSGEEECLHDLVVKCLEGANATGFSSIAIPALSAGIFGYPADEATRVITEGVRTYLNGHMRNNNLQQVYLCGFTADIVDHFVRAIKKHFPSSATIKQKPTPFPKSRNAHQPRPVQNAGLQSAGQRVIRISVVEGEIAQQNTDVIVNSTSNGLDLKNGAVSSSILRAAGHGLQDECKQKYPKGIETTEIAFTTSHNLNCKGVLHLALCNYNNSNAEQILGQMVIKCLKEVTKHNYTSIAFPPLGSGNLGYPLDVVADTMIGAIEQFEKETHGFSVREVKIIVYNSPDTVKAFASRVGTFQAGGRQQSSPKGPTGRRENRKFSDTPFSQQSASSASHLPNVNAEFDLGDLRLIVKQGDITEENVDAIINSTNDSLDLSRGAVSSALRQKCGPELEAACRKEVAEMKRTGIVYTKVRRQPFKAVLHIDANRFSNDWKTGIQNLLKTADGLGMTSISTPALGTGAGGLTPSKSARDLMKALCDFCSRKPQNLNEVRIVMFEKSMIPQTIQVIQDVGEKLSKSKEGVLGFFKALAGFGGPSLTQTYNSPVVEEAKLFVYGESAESIRQAIRHFGDLVKDKFTRKEIVDEIIPNMNEDELQKIKTAGQSHNVEVKIQPFAGRIVIDGMHADVFDAASEINKLIREADRYRQQAQQASMLANMVQWCYLEVTPTGTEQKEYKEHENQIIEMAYQQKKKIATIKDSSDVEYIIDFDSMKEYPKQDPNDSVAVIRKDKMKESSSGVLPENWTIQPDKENLKLVKLSPQNSEYQDVENNFRSTLGGAAVTVLSIERIENPTQYRQYMAKKAHLEKQNTGIQNEKMLWHGTASDALSNINHYGFNRSYCGKNATVYGQGVYFAVNSQYSAHPTYSPPDPSTGQRYMYQCKVLVGHPVAGNNAMRFLPARSGPIQYDSSTDNLRNPTLYAIFNDTQAYPEYLITFR